MSWMATTVSDSIRTVFVRVADALPALLGAIIILVIGWVVSGLAQKAAAKLLKTIRLDELADRVRISEFLSRGEIRLSLSELIGLFLYWLLMLAFALAALNALGLTVAAGLLERVLAYVPDVLAGVIVLVLGFFFAAVVSGIVQTATANMGVTQAKGLAQIARVAVLIFAVAIALEKFFSSMIVQATFTIILSAAAFGTALAFGLGCKEIAGRAVADFLDKVRGGR
ncbi:MAG: hypothetical protein HYZ94_03385 [Candidatus Omnitrophica bacterium]|nr:hypothetical protein [Candidatus Omnitrophota bacterium]